MDWDQKQQNPSSSTEDHSQLNNNGGGGMFVKVMTDEQMEVLRKQIAVYATICEQLVELHKSLTAHNDLAAGVRLGNIYCDPLMTSGAHKISGRQRWTPTPMQLQILERMFEQGIGTPSKQKIKEITSELSQHGQISETNVYNWFQNRRARSKRKQQTTTQSNNCNNAESEVETEVESPGHEKKTKPSDEGFSLQQQMLGSGKRDDDAAASFHDPRIDDDSIFGGDFGQMVLYGSMLSNPRTDHLIAKVEVDGSYNSYMQQPDHDYNIP